LGLGLPRTLPRTTNEEDPLAPMVLSKSCSKTLLRNPGPRVQQNNKTTKQQNNKTTMIF